MAKCGTYSGRWLAGHLLQPEILILAGAVEDHITLAQAEEWCDLRHTRHVHLEIAEHFVRGPPPHGSHAVALPKENQRPAFFR